MAKLNREKQKLSPELQKIKNTVVPILKSNGITKAGIFGSFVRNEQNKDSDVDILIEFDGSLLKLVGIQLEIQKQLKKEIDLLTYKGLHPYLKKQILSEEVRIL